MRNMSKAGEAFGVAGEGLKVQACCGSTSRFQTDPSPFSSSLRPFSHPLLLYRE